MERRQRKRNESGFTYLELVIGIVILSLGIGFFTPIYQFSRSGAVNAREEMAMAMASTAQNMAQVLLATKEEAKAVAVGTSQGYPTQVVLGDAIDPNTYTIVEGIKRATITVSTKLTTDPLDPKYVEPYVLNFYLPD